MSGIEAWSTSAGSNNMATPNGWPEGQAPSSVNDCARQMMASIRAQMEDAQWFNWGHTPTRIDNDTFTVATDLTAVYSGGRRLKLTGSATEYCTISASSYSAPNTTVDVVMDSGNIPGTLSAVYVSILTATNPGMPLSVPSWAVTGNATVGGTLGVTGVITGIGSGLTALNASNLSSGTVPDARFPATLPAVSGANLTSLPAANLTGSIADARLSSNVPLKNAANTFLSLQTVSGVSPGLETTVAGAAAIRITNASGTSRNAAVLFNDNVGTKWRVGPDVSTSNNSNVLDFYSDTLGASVGRMFSDGGTVLGAPTGGDKGAGTLNTAGAIYQNGTLVQDSGTFTGTLTGCTTSPTVTVYWARCGSVVTLSYANVNGVSNSGSLTMTGMTGNLIPAVARSGIHCLVEDNASQAEAHVSIGTGGVMTFGLSPFTSSFTAFGNKGVKSSTFSYLL